MQSLEEVEREKDAERNHLTLEIHASIARLNILKHYRRTVRETAEDDARERERGLEVTLPDHPAPSASYINHPPPFPKCCCLKNNFFSIRPSLFSKNKNNRTTKATLSSTLIQRLRTSNLIFLHHKFKHTEGRQPVSLKQPQPH